jgi:hypothetical protein
MDDVVVFGVPTEVAVDVPPAAEPPITFTSPNITEELLAGAPPRPGLVIICIGPGDSMN